MYERSEAEDEADADADVDWGWGVERWSLYTYQNGGILEALLAPLLNYSSDHCVYPPLQEASAAKGYLH